MFDLKNAIISMLLSIETRGMLLPNLTVAEKVLWFAVIGLFFYMITDYISDKVKEVRA